MAEPRLAICAIAKNEALYIEEWLAFHFLQGVAEIRVYDHGSGDGMAEILARVGRRAPVTRVDWGHVGPPHGTHQLTAYADGTAYFAGRADWVAFIDIDEFIRSRRGKSLPAELARFNRDVGAIGLQQTVFGSAGREAYDHAPVLARFDRCAPAGHPSGRWFKTLARPEAIEFFTTVHSVALRQGRAVLADHAGFSLAGTHGGCADRVAQGTLELRHYMMKSTEEIAWKQARFATTTRRAVLTDEYFASRNEFANAARAESLAGVVPKVEAMVAAWRLGG